eukprot:GHUV01029459.1.p1 GENE.GHUV01029459.1~~GHUV01029459.1.p1  ORF type:complete len:331 (+),score=64.27 GHUV01029459.1:448-1440(+)
MGFASVGLRPAFDSRLVVLSGIGYLASVAEVCLPAACCEFAICVLQTRRNTACAYAYQTDVVVAVCRSMVGIRTLDFHNTSISGTIPEIWASFPYLEYVDITSTRMTCCTSQAYVDATPVNDLLPKFLFFDGNLTQYDAARGIEDKDLLDPVQPTDLMCGSVQRDTSLQRDEWNYFDLPVTNNALSKQKWHISPVYSWYKNCTCTPGFDQDNSPSARVPVVKTTLWCKNWSAPWQGDCLDMYTFQCRLHEEPQLSLQGKVGLALGGALMFVVLVVAANMCMAYASKVRRLYVRAKMRLQGVPKHGKMSLVVTDIEGYSGGAGGGVLTSKL